MGDVMKLASDSSPMRVGDFNARDATNFAKGFLQSTEVGTFPYTQLLECIMVADKEVQFALQGLRLLEDAYETKNETEAVQGVIAVISFVKGLQGVMGTCNFNEAALNWRTFDEIVSTLRNPLKTLKIVGKEIVVNGKEITAEFSGALEAGHNGEFEQVGSIIGATMRDTCEANSLFLY